MILLTAACTICHINFSISSELRHGHSFFAMSICVSLHKGSTFLKQPPLKFLPLSLCKLSVEACRPWPRKINNGNSYSRNHVGPGQCCTQVDLETININIYIILFKCSFNIFYYIIIVKKLYMYFNKKYTGVYNKALQCGTHNHQDK